MQNISTANIKVKKVSAREIIDSDDELVVEEPLEIQLIYDEDSNQIQKSISVTMRTPGNDEELGVGFLFTEGIIRNRQQIQNVQQDPHNENILSITLRKNERPSLQKADRNFYSTSSCGVCGKSSIDAIRTTSIYKDTTAKISVNSDVFFALDDELRKQQAIFESTGGLHASALFDLDGNFLTLREDVGRHNALDKVIGSAFLDEQLPLNNTILLLSGRASFELIQKAEMAGIKIIAAVGAPSSLAVGLAENSGMTLIGFLRNKRFNIYSGDQRINL